MECSSERFLACYPRRRGIWQSALVFRNVLRRENEIHATRRNGAARHRVVARLFVLGEGNPALGLDRVQSERTVGCRAGQNHADSASSSSTAKNTSHGPNCEPVLDVLSVMYITNLVGS